jgi:hypothetical protein
MTDHDIDVRFEYQILNYDKFYSGSQMGDIVLQRFYGNCIFHALRCKVCLLDKQSDFLYNS